MVGRRVISIRGSIIQKQPEPNSRRRLLSISYHTTTTTTTTMMMMFVVMIILVLLPITKLNAFHVIPSRFGFFQKSYGISTTTTAAAANRRPDLRHPTPFRTARPRRDDDDDDDDDDTIPKIVINSHVQHDHPVDSCHLHTDCDCHSNMNHVSTISQQHSTNSKNVWRRLWNRFNVLHTMKVQSEKNINDIDHSKTIILTAGIGSGLFGAIKKLHDPITYFVLGILAGFRYDWCFRSPVYWFAIGFTIKWYRARYVFKIPVWDRQPNWNNIITSKEQEKDLKAFTCKNCGSTIFIAKTREFFFEGNTGIGGLGCFSCGARGKDNFIMDRDRIVEDVGDMDDYFEYERPLDFVSRAERRKLLKEAQGDEDKANQLLLERTTGMSSTSSTTTSSSTTITSTTTDTTAGTIDAVIVDDEADATTSTSMDETTIQAELMEVPQLLDDETSTTVTEADDASFDEESPPNGKTRTSVSHDPEQADDTELQNSRALESKPPAVRASSKPKNSSSLGLDGLDELDMDAW
jgi:hypothetical protein